MNIDKKTIVGVVLFVSIALNVTLAVKLMNRSGPRRPNASPMLTFASNLSSLPEDQREKAKEIVKYATPKLREANKAMIEARQDTLKYMQDESYTRTEAESRLGILRERGAESQALSHAVTLDILDMLTPEQRVAFIKDNSFNKAQGGRGRGKGRKQ